MDDELTRFWTNLVGRVSGPLSLRLILQPLVATAFAIRAGLQDARAGKPLYTKTVLTHPTHHLDMLREGTAPVEVRVLAAGTPVTPPVAVTAPASALAPAPAVSPAAPPAITNWTPRVQELVAW